MKEFKYLINGNLYTATLVKRKGNTTELSVNGKTYAVTSCEVAPKPVAYSRPAQAAMPLKGPSSTSSSERTISSPLPGSVLSIDCKIGDTVAKGQKIAVIEAMKMENVISSDYDGTVSEILASKGDTILEGAAIIRLK